MKSTSRRQRTGFTLVEVLIVMVIMAIIASVVLPKAVEANVRARYASRSSTLRLYQEAIDRFYNDTGIYPASLDDLASTSAPIKGINRAGNTVSINASSWHGPYLLNLPKDPVTNNNYVYASTAPTVGKVAAPLNLTSVPIGETVDESAPAAEDNVESK